MSYIHLNDYKMHDTCIAFGHFDGLHIGHMEVLSVLKEREKSGLTSIMLQLEDPELFLASKCLTTPDENRYILKDNTPQVIIAHPLTVSSSNIEPEEFITNLLLNKMGARTIVAGANCRFGKDGRGDAQLLSEFAEIYDFEAHIVDTVYEGDNIITSDIIRSDLESGNLAWANQRLGYRYSLRGRVIPGNEANFRARMPTVTMQPHASKLIPAHGVYATITKVDGEHFYGLTNIGLRPSIGDLEHVTIETFIPNFDRNIHGKAVETQLCLYVRETRKFGSLNEVRAQIDLDLEQVRTHFDRNWSA